MSSTILVPLDGSKFSESALPWAFAISDAWGASVRVANVHELPPAPDLGYMSIDVAVAWSREYLDRVVERVRDATGRQVEPVLLSGPPSRAIERYATEEGVDMVVMATHGRGPLSRLWLGSVADALSRQTTTPLLLVRPDEDDASGVDLSRSVSAPRLLVPLDGSDLSEAALPHATRLADVFGSDVDLVRVFPYPERFVSTYLPHTIQENARLLEQGKDSARAYVARVATRLRESGFDVDAEVLVDHTSAAGILHRAEQRDTDVIVMATHGYGGVRRALIGSVTDKVVRGSPVPVLVVHPEAA